MVKSMALETVKGIEAERNAPKVFLETVKALKPGTVFTADTLAEATKGAAIPQEIGAWFRTPEFRELADGTEGAVKSRRTKGWIGIWVRRNDEQMEVAT